MLTATFTRVGTIFAILTLLGVGGIWPGSAGPSRAQAGGPENAKIKELLRERLSVVRKIAAETEKDYKAGKVSFDRVHQAQRAVLHARLELCESDKERAAVLEEAVSLAKDYEKTAAQLYQAGKVPVSDALQATANRLEAEIALERGKARGIVKPK